MSDTPPDRKEEADAPEGPRNPWVGYLVWAILVPVLYVLSYAPVRDLVAKGYIPENIMHIYDPLNYLPGTLTEPFMQYIRWWQR